MYERQYWKYSQGNGTFDNLCDANKKGRSGGEDAGPAVESAVQFREVTYTAMYIVFPWRFTSSRDWSFEFRMALSKSCVLFTGR